LGHVAGAGHYRIAELRPQLLGSGRDAVQDPDARTLLDKALDHCAPDARAPARDERHLPIEPTHAQVLLSDANRALWVAARPEAGRCFDLRLSVSSWQVTQISPAALSEPNGIGRRLVSGW
jgi:hypothetical protein